MQLAADANQLLNSLDEPQLAPFLNAWPLSCAQRSAEPAPLPVLRWLPELRKAAPPFSLRFVIALEQAAPLLAWRRSYTLSEVGGAFFDNYGWSELVGLEGPLASERLACGMLLLGSHVTYPPHSHEAEEIYVPLAGVASWKRGNGAWKEHEPGALIHHARYEPHAMRTGTSALLALYLWCSNDLAQKSQLVPASAAI